jgi:hypothetical protein
MPSLPEGRTTRRPVKNRGRRIGLIVAVVFTVGGTVTATTVPASAGALTVLGGIDMSHACWEQHSTSAVSLVDDGSVPVFRWKCGQVFYESVDMTRACRVQYQRTDAWAAWTDQYNPYSWKCYI